jgi:hypothetical protein
MNFNDTPSNNGTSSTPELTPTLAQEIFDTDGTPQEIFKSSSFEPEHIKTVYKHGLKLRAVMRQAMRGEYIITPAIPATYDDEGNELTPYVPPVYFEPTTSSAFVTFMEGVYEDLADKHNEDVLLDITDVGLQLMDGLTWQEWKASFNE